MFLLNDFVNLKDRQQIRGLSKELTDALIEQKKRFPEIRILFITDPINTVYDGLENHFLENLNANGITVVQTNVERLRDSNPVYSAFWRLLLRPLAPFLSLLLPNPFGPGQVPLSSYLRLLNFKTNHRKVILADSPEGPAAVVTSANPHDASSVHENTGIYFTGPAVLDLLETENAVLEFSGYPPCRPVWSSAVSPVSSDTSLQILTESKIRDAVLHALQNAGPGDAVKMVMFYLSHREIIRELLAAHQRGASLQILLDPNKDAFGLQKNGIPNRQVGLELQNCGITVRWMDTHGEQAHSKLLLIDYVAGKSFLILGSANFSRRDLDDFNLETDVAVRGPETSDIFVATHDYFDLLWSNTPQKIFSTGFPKYEDPSWWRIFLYHFMERSGMSTF